MAVPLGATQQVAIVGGGLAGTALAIKLLRDAREPLSVCIVEPAAELGRGLAYSTDEPGHLLNGPAHSFTLFPDTPDDFVDWLARQPEHAGMDRAALAMSFLPRRRFGDYVRDTLALAQRNAAPCVTFEHVAARVDDLDATADGVTLALDIGRVLLADHAVLALGVFQARPRFDEDGSLAQTGRYVADPWNRQRLAALAEQDEVVLVGASLTMVDAVVSLDRLGYRGAYRVLTRHGLTPVARRLPPAADDLLAPDSMPHSTRDMLRALRAASRTLAARGDDWQALPAALRPHLAGWWPNVPVAERRRFFRHVRPYWDVFLHRAPPPSIAVVDALRASGRLTIEAATVTGLASAPRDLVRVDYRPRGGVDTRHAIANAVVNCAGPDYRWHDASEHRLVRNLLARGLVHPGPAGLGIAADASLAVVARDGTRSTRLSVLGAALRGTFLEPGAIPDIAAHTSALGQRLMHARDANHAVQTVDSRDTVTN